MRKHLFGIATFIAIVSSTAMIYSVFRSYEIPTVPMAIHLGDDKKYSCDYVSERISYRIISAEYEMRSGRFISEIELEWNGKSSPPETVYMSLFLYENDHQPERVAVAPNVLERPFEKGNKYLANVSLPPNTAGKFRDWDNIYAYVDFARDIKFPSTREERMKKLEFVPVLKVH